MTENLISIIIPTYNRAHLISETLDSISAQTYANWECIVVDDGSTDETERVLQKYQEQDARFIYVKRPENRPKGGNAARNFGFEKSSGDYIQWFDSDDILLHTAIEIKKEVLESGDFDFVVCQGADIGRGDKTPTVHWLLQHDGNRLLNHIRGIIAFGTNGPLFKKSFLEGKKLFDEDLSIRQEWEFFSRLLITEPNIAYITKPLYQYRTEATGIRRNKSYTKTKGIMRSERRLLEVINMEKPFSANDDYSYRKSVYNRIKKHGKTVYKHKSIKGMFYLIGTGLRLLTFNFIKELFSRTFIRP